MAYANRNPNSFAYYKSIKNIFINQNQSNGFGYQSITRVDDIWKWMSLILVPNLKCSFNYGTSSINYPGYISDQQSYLLGSAYLRQLRVKNGKFR